MFQFAELAMRFRRPNEVSVTVAVSHAHQELPGVAPLQAEIRAAKDRRLFRMMGYLTLTMFICWMPGNVFWTMYNVDASVYNFSIAMTVSLMMFMNSVSNPLLYQTGSNEMRRVLTGMLRIPFSEGSAANRDVTIQNIYSSMDSAQKRQLPLRAVDENLRSHHYRNQNRMMK